MYVLHLEKPKMQKIHIDRHWAIALKSVKVKLKKKNWKSELIIEQKYIPSPPLLSKLHSTEFTLL